MFMSSIIILCTCIRFIFRKKITIVNYYCYIHTCIQCLKRLNNISLHNNYYSCHRITMLKNKITLLSFFSFTLYVAQLYNIVDYLILLNSIRRNILQSVYYITTLLLLTYWLFITCIYLLLLECNIIYTTIHKYTRRSVITQVLSFAY